MRLIHCTVGENLSLTQGHVSELMALLTFVHDKLDLGGEAHTVLLKLTEIENAMAKQQEELEARDQKQMDDAMDDPRY